MLPGTLQIHSKTCDLSFGKTSFKSTYCFRSLNSIFISDLTRLVNLFFFFPEVLSCPSGKWDLDFCLTSSPEPKKTFCFSGMAWISLMVIREKYLTSHGPDARKRTCRGKLLQKKWCAEDATIPSLKLGIKMIISPVNLYFQNRKQSRKHFPLLHYFFEWVVMNLWRGRHNKPL